MHQLVQSPRHDAARERRRGHGAARRVAGKRRIGLTALVTLAVVAAAPGPARASFPGGPGLIAFTNSSGIAAVNPDGTGVHQIVNDTQAYAPQWSPAGDKLVYLTGLGVIHTVNPDGTGNTTVTSAPGSTEATWSPDGKRIAFDADYLDPSDPNSGCSQLYAVNADGTGRTSLTFDNTSPGHDKSYSFPRWSPDGTQILADVEAQMMGNTSACGTNDGVWSVSPSGSGPISHVLPAPDTDPEWSPDGKQIAFDDQSHVFVKTLATGTTNTITQIDPSMGALWQPAFSPDGARLAYWRWPCCPNPPQGASLHLINLDGTNDVAVGQTRAGLYSTIGWQPQDGVVILSGPSGYVPTSTVKFEFAVPGSGSSEQGDYQCARDGGPYKPCMSPYTIAGLSDGSHELDIAFGPPGSQPGQPGFGQPTIRQFHVDTTPPTVSIDSAPTGTVNVGEATIAFHSTNEPEGENFTCVVDGSAPFACSSPYRLAGLAQGPHTFSVFATDAIGNKSNTASAMWTVSGCPATGCAPPPPCPPGQVSQAQVGLSLIGKGCFIETRPRGGAPIFTAAKAVTMDGIGVDPGPGAQVIFDNQQRKVRFTGPVTLDLGVLKFALPHATEFTPAQTGKALSLPGYDWAKQKLLGVLSFAVDPVFEYSAAQGGSAKFGLTVTLPTAFKAVVGQIGPTGPKQPELTVTFTVNTSNAMGVSYSGKASLKQAALFGWADLKNISLAIDSGTPTVPASIEGGLTLIPGTVFGGKGELTVALKLSPGSSGPLGPVQKFSATIDKLNIPLINGIYLQKLGLELGGKTLTPSGGPAVSATTLAGTAGLSFGPIFKIPGFFEGAIASAEGTLSLTLPPAAYFPRLFEISVLGTGRLLEIPVGDLSMTWNKDGSQTFAIAGNLDLTTKSGFGLRGSIYNSFFELKTNKWNVQAQGSLNLYFLSAEAQLVISQRGMAACAGTTVGERWGFGVYWPNDLRAFSSACDVGNFSVAATPAQAGATRRFVVARATSMRVIELDRAASVPNVTLTGPGGERIPADSPTPISNAAEVIVADAAGHRRFILLFRPAPGVWTVTPDAGSTVATMRLASNLPPDRVHAGVQGHGRTRTLRWSLRSIPGQQVTFAEVGPQVTRTLISTNRARGQFRFVPESRSARTRQIVAFVTENGLQRDRFVVAHFTAPALPPLLRVRQIRLRAHTLSWRREAAATSYSITVVGRGTPLATYTHRDRLRIPRSVGGQPYRVSITPLDTRGARIGPTTSVRLR